MADVHDKATRSYNMSQIRGKDTKPELLVRKLLFRHGFRYRIHDKKLPGKPDIVLKKYKTVVFVHGCFWHGHENCRYYVIPKTNTEKWQNKILGNQRNDELNKQLLIREGWTVISIYECELKKDKLSGTIFSLINKIKIPIV